MKLLCFLFYGRFVVCGLLLWVDNVCVVLKLLMFSGVLVFFVLFVIIMLVLLYVIICAVWLMLCMLEV